MWIYTVIKTGYTGIQVKHMVKIYCLEYRASYMSAHVLLNLLNEERSGSMVECLTRDQGVAGSRLTRGIALCPWARHFIICLVLGQPRKTCPDITEKE